MIKILFVMVAIVTMIALAFWANGVKYLKKDEYNKKGIKYILLGTSVTGICIILNAILFIPTFYQT
ncbi:hypothetical protein [Clostridium lacusfryxellense]|uniref:hypothetical protein n=1 Tax=Clostridium lacusfryxellense TaxID=205328 RepID=UPI001C0D4F2B|nr:hypothetical protein [Clostridium lacusfryxellense]MBU3112910.1 hypothetical protein [Clostridium lacusfryxellense]